MDTLKRTLSMLVILTFMLGQVACLADELQGSTYLDASAVTGVIPMGYEGDAPTPYGELADIFDDVTDPMAAYTESGPGQEEISPTTSENFEIQSEDPGTPPEEDEENVTEEEMKEAERIYAEAEKKALEANEALGRANSQKTTLLCTMNMLNAEIKLVENELANLDPVSRTLARIYYEKRLADLQNEYNHTYESYVAILLVIQIGERTVEVLNELAEEARKDYVRIQEAYYEQIYAICTHCGSTIGECTCMEIVE